MLPVQSVDSNDYLDRLYPEDVESFEEEYKQEYNSIDDEEAKSLVKSDFRSNKQPKREVFRAVKNAFHPDNSDGYRTEYEAHFTNPLYEIKKNPADLLLAETNRRSVNLCLVVCEADGDLSDRWANHINEVHDLVKGHKDHLLRQLGQEGKKIEHIQYATVTKKEEYRDVEFRYIRHNAPDAYSLWTVDGDYDPDLSETSPPLVLLKAEEGYIDHSKLNAPLSDGVDYLDSKNTEISIALTTPPLIALQETLMTLLTGQHNSIDEPREFNHDDFVRIYKDLCEVGLSGDDKTDLLESEANSLIELAKEADIVYYGDDDSIHENRDYRARYSQGKSTEGLKESIRKKLFKQRTPAKKSRMAFDNVKKRFTPDRSVGSKVDDWF